jgi:hypothetical protein
MSADDRYQNAMTRTVEYQRLTHHQVSNLELKHTNTETQRHCVEDLSGGDSAWSAHPLRFTDT